MISSDSRDARVRLAMNGGSGDLVPEAAPTHDGLPPERAPYEDEGRPQRADHASVSALDRVDPGARAPVQPDEPKRPEPRPKRSTRATRTTARAKRGPETSSDLESNDRTAAHADARDMPRYSASLPEPRPEQRAERRAARTPDARDSSQGEPRPIGPAPARTGPRSAVELDVHRIDPDVQKVVRRLVRHGYEAYLVGGCVRDLLLGRQPKDFDVATSARPEQVRELFRNSRVIGRRFRLVHVLFHGGKVIEVATFRKNPKEDLDDDNGVADGSQLLIRSDNVFGRCDEDAMRRDFTINALFYDLEAGEIIDWVGGLADVERRTVNTIGEPEIRFREDPVRILRALKFAGRLDLGITPEVYAAIVACRESLELAARPRLAEEILRLLRSGQARRTVYLAWELGVLDVLLPELSTLLYDSFAAPEASSPLDGSRSPVAGERVFRLLEFVDRRTIERDPLDDTVLWTLLLLEPMKEAADGAKDRSAAVADFLEPVIERLAIPRRFADGMRRIIAVLPRLVTGRAGRFARTEIFDLAVDVAEAELYAQGLPTAPVAALRAGPPGATRSPRSGSRLGPPDHVSNLPVVGSLFSEQPAFTPAAEEPRRPRSRRSGRGRERRQPNS